MGWLRLSSRVNRWHPHDDDKCTDGAVSSMGETGEKPYFVAAAFFRGGDRPRSDSPRGRPFGLTLPPPLPFTNGFSVHDESLEFEWLCPWLCWWACMLCSAYGDCECTAPCNCLFAVPVALMSDGWCRWPLALIGDALLAVPLE